ncbi:CTP synthase, partial [Candidatus Micrarchaeota archaeon]|nr:CTP synthase [Candidatus Micrarchaeota archaeon]
RLGAYPAKLKEGTVTHELYNHAGKIKNGIVEERHRHRYEVNPDYHGVLQEKGLVISGFSPDGVLAEFIELPNHKFFIATQSHPEFTSWPGRPNPLFYGLIAATSRGLQ